MVQQDDHAKPSIAAYIGRKRDAEDDPYSGGAYDMGAGPRAGNVKISTGSSRRGSFLRDVKATASNGKSTTEYCVAKMTWSLTSTKQKGGTLR